MLIVFSGLPGVVETTLARVSARRLGALHLRIDTIDTASRPIDECVEQLISEIFLAGEMVIR